MKTILRSAVLGAWLAVAAGSALAAEPMAQSADDFIKALSPAKSDEVKMAPPGMRTRGLSLGASNTAPVPVAPRKVSFQVEFEFDSAKLSPKATQILDELARALQSPDLSAGRFQLTGYTDASGRAAYNLKLSKARAESVRDYLVSKGGIAASRLEAGGKGSENLLDPANPTSGVNRRVEIANIGG